MNEIKTTITDQLQQLQMLMHRASFHGFRTDGRSHNPHRGQGRVLSMLKMKPEISQKELASLLDMSKQSLAQLLSKLEKSGHITREPSEEDKRVMIIKLTEEGKNASNTDSGSELFETEKILDCLDDEELAALSGYLTRIIERYEEQFPNEHFEERRRHREQFMHEHGQGRGREFAGFKERRDNRRDGREYPGRSGQPRSFSHGSQRKGQFHEHKNEHDRNGK